MQGTMILACALGGTLGPWLGGFLHDITGSYQSILILAQVFLVASAVLMWLLKPGRSANPDEDQWRGHTSRRNPSW